ncbi:protein of unknown function [Candidatus Nitrosocosmicus franklandus]|uniref:Uncharacterized protein n=1 Tax=Candidatus Nitrosocosmicus franklandianus TaxID=1798806 RepID=A0A484IF46_9ARCH|nr:protein of unknown function [Candidatus Nitrosocosmicus franklandus]
MVIDNGSIRFEIRILAGNILFRFVHIADFSDGVATRFNLKIGCFSLFIN